MNKSKSSLNNIGSFFLHGNIKTCYQEDRKSPNFISTFVIYMYKTPVNIQCVNVLTFLCMGGRYHTSATNAQLVSRSKMCWTIPILLLFQKASPYRLSYYKQNRKMVRYYYQRIAQYSKQRAVGLFILINRSEL